MRFFCSFVLWTLICLTSQVYGRFTRPNGRHRHGIGFRPSLQPYNDKGSGYRLSDRPFKNATQTTFPMVFVADDNQVYMVDEAGKETQLSTTGSEAHYFDYENIYISKNNTFAVVYQTTDIGTNRSIYLVESNPADQLQPNYLETFYEKPGDVNEVQVPRLYDLVNKKEIPIAKDFVDDPWFIEDASWQFKHDTYRYMYYARGFKLVRMIELDMTGSTRIVMEETGDTYLDYFDKLAWDFMNETDQLWWLSDRTNFNHVYLVNTSRDIPWSPDNVKQITSGDFEVWDVGKVDEKEKVLFGRAFELVPEQNPYYKHVFRVNLDGTGFKVLTADGDGNHRATWFNDTNNFEDRWSRVDTPVLGALRDADGNKIGEVGPDPDYAFVPDKWTVPEKFHAPGRDGKTLIYGTITLPRNFNKDKKYRVIEECYAGPWGVHGAFDAYDQYSMIDFQRVADMADVVVVHSDGMGTNWRGKEFQAVAHGNISDAGFPDRIAWIKAAAAERPYMDLNGGVGIYGTSAGGQQALAALIWYSDFYSAAVACSGDHDFRIAQQFYGEQWGAYPADTNQAQAIFEAGSNVVHAKEMKGQLLLICGELDYVVDPSCTYQVAHELNKAGLDYDFMPVPNAGHAPLYDWGLKPLQDKVFNHWKKWKATTGK